MFVLTYLPDYKKSFNKNIEIYSTNFQTKKRNILEIINFLKEKDPKNIDYYQHHSKPTYNDAIIKYFTQIPINLYSCKELNQSSENKYIIIENKCNINNILIKKPIKPIIKSPKLSLLELNSHN